MRTLRREKTKTTLNNVNNDDPSNRSARNILPKPDLDFAAEVEKGRSIKDKIRQRFDERISLVQAQHEESYNKESHSHSFPTPVHYRRGGLSLNAGSSLMDGHIAAKPFTEEDSKVSSSKRVGIFPVSDEKFFPPRRKAVGWEVGLRSHSTSTPPITSINTSVKHEKTVVERPSVILPATQTTAVATASVSDSANSSLQPVKSSDDVETLPAMQDLRRPSIRLSLIPDPSEEESGKYFGPEAKKKFHDSYHQLSAQADMLLGGYDTLHEVVKSKDHNSVLLAALHALQNEGVLSPRRDVDNRPHTTGPKSVLRSAERGRSVQRPLPPLQINQFDNDESPLSAESMNTVQWKEVIASEEKQHLKGDSSKLDDYSYVDSAGELTYNLGSPRAIFLSGCLKYSLPPRAQVLLRKQPSSTINLAHMGIGNQMAIILADSLQDLPYLQVLNLRDNNLEDSGLSALLRSIKNHRTIEILDISQNIIDAEAADALADLVGNPECRLAVLRLSDANIDDSECARFVHVLMHNRHLKELDLSKNLLGKDENLNVVQPDFETGGESLAELIRADCCPIQTLHLHWNMIRLEGAEVLCDSFRYNRHLLHVDLSYNALGRNAAGVLGVALSENNTIESINLANNGIDAIGTFTLLVGLRENHSVRRLVIDGNPIGEQGARMLMKLAASDGHRLDVSAKNCDFAIQCNDIKFRVDYPFGEHILNLCKPYDRAILYELLDIYSMDTGVEITSFDYLEDNDLNPVKPAEMERNSNGLFATALSYRVEKYEEESKLLSAQQEAEIVRLQALERLAKMTPENIRSLLTAQDVLHQNGITQSRLLQVLQSLQMNPAKEILQQINLTLDPNRLGVLGLDGLVEYITSKAQTAKLRIWQMQHKPQCALRLLMRADGPSSKLIPANPDEKLVAYLPPQSGYVRVRVVESYDSGDEKKVPPYTLTATKCAQVIKIANMSTNPVLLLTYAIESTKLHLEEGQKLYQQIFQKSDDPTPLLGKLLMHMLTSDDAMRMIACFVGGDIVKIRRLKQRLGAAYYPVIGIYSGFYCLDLSDGLDRLCMKILIEKSVRSTQARHRKGLWDTSQNGQWSCFRNDYSPDNSIPSISFKYLFPIPRKGKIEFDFVSIERPDISLCQPVCDDRIVECLLLSRLLSQDKVEWANQRLRSYESAIRRSLLTNGAPTWKPEQGLAMSVATHIFTMYNGLSQRRSARQKVAKRELIKTAVVVEKKEKKRETKGGRTNYFSSSASLRKSASQRINLQATETVNAVSSEEVEAEEGKSGGSTPFSQRTQTKVKEAAAKFRALVKLSPYSERLQIIWGSRLFEAIESTGTDEYKSATLLDFFESELVSFWLDCRQAALILEIFSPLGLLNRSNIGSYRVELLIMIFDRIVDLHNIELVLATLNAEEQAALRVRIGILNLFNPSKPEGGYSFDLSRWEERQVTRMLVHLSVIEPGENWLNKSFCFDRGFPPIPGWELSVTWLTEEGLPRKGLLSFEFFAGDGLQQYNCKVDVRLRKILSPLVLIPQRDVVAELQQKHRQMIGRDDQEAQIWNSVCRQLGLFSRMDEFEYWPSGGYMSDFTWNNSTAAKMKIFTIEDSNHSLKDGTEITWNYTNDGAAKSEFWMYLD